MIYTPIEEKNQAWMMTLAGPMADRVRRMLVQATQTGLPSVIVEGWRSPQRQQYLYSHGQTRAKPWKSQHQWGLAVDVVPVDSQGNLWWNAPVSVWNPLGEIGEMHGLRWGGRFTPPDRGHFEFPIHGKNVIMISGIVLGLGYLLVRGIYR
jgi:peptidoglycan L-alanyl-D-glutamate endopeptidase CwlK